MNDPAKETPKQPAPHKPAKADYRHDQITRYMRQLRRPISHTKAVC